jgi:hypothetical protein
MRMDFETETFCVEVVPAPVGFSCKDSGADAMEDAAPTMRAMGHRASHPNAGGQLAVAFRGFGQDGFAPSDIAPPVLASDGGSVGPPVVFESRFARNGRGAPGIVAPPLKAQSGTSGRGDGAPLLVTWVAVRRLTARECERLQGLPSVVEFQNLESMTRDEIAACLLASGDIYTIPEAGKVFRWRGPGGVILPEPVECKGTMVHG